MHIVGEKGVVVVDCEVVRDVVDCWGPIRVEGGNRGVCLPPDDQERYTLQDEHERGVEREVQERPDLLSDTSEMLFLQAVKVYHVQKVDDQHRSDDLTDHRTRPEVLVLDNLGDGFADDDDTFAEHDQSEQGHALHHMRALERHNAPDAAHADCEQCL